MIVYVQLFWSAVLC